MALPESICANWDPGVPDCAKTAPWGCENCRLVSYCGYRCRMNHWRQHRFHCKSELGEPDWQPSYVREERAPAFFQVDFMPELQHSNSIWSNLPAYDVLKLESHEGVDREEGVKILFADSLDLQNVVKTIVELPSGYNHPIEITLNSKETDKVARNVMLLLVALRVEDMEEAIDCMIHLWYSAAIRKSDLDILQTRVFPLIWNVYNNVKKFNDNDLLRKTWTFGDRTLSCTLTKKGWFNFVSLLKFRPWMKYFSAATVRRETTLCPGERDYLERELCKFSCPWHRVSYTQYRTDGLPVPLSYPRHEFIVPNPTFFPQHPYYWPAPTDDPRHAWPVGEVAQTDSGAASNDMYGQLFHYLRATLRKFIMRIPDIKASVHVTNVEVRNLPEHLPSNTFDRIETPDISQLSYLEVHRPIEALTPLLQPPSVNPHARMIALYRSAVNDAATYDDHMSFIAASNPATDLVPAYIDTMKPMTSPFCTTITRWQHARKLLTRYDHVFHKYVQTKGLDSYGRAFGAEMVERNTIIERSPFHLKLRPWQKGAQEEFDRFIAAGVTGRERYVEFKRVTPASMEATDPIEMIVPIEVPDRAGAEDGDDPMGYRIEHMITRIWTAAGTYREHLIP